jgi:hypothetical protein
MIHDLVLTKDTRASFLVETFGFGVGGWQNITTTVPFSSTSPNAMASRFCFLIKVTPSDNSQFLDDNLNLVQKTKKKDNTKTQSFQKCSAPDKNDVVIPVDWTGGNPDVRKILEKPAGFSNLYFVNEDKNPVSFGVRVAQKSIGKNYIAVGDLPLPMFFLLAAVV